MPTDRNISELIFNEMTKEKYEELKSTNSINNNEFYMIKDDENSEDIYLKTTGGTMTGALDVGGKASIDTNGYVKGTWLQMTADTSLGSTPNQGVCVKQNDWIYTRTLAQFKEDLGVGGASGVTVTLSANNWAAQADGSYAQTVSVSGVTSTNQVVVDCALTGSDIASDIAVLKDWGYVNRASQASGSLTFYCYGEKPTISLPLNVVVM